MPHLFAHSLILSWAGMRGVVSLAQVLSQGNTDQPNRRYVEWEFASLCSNAVSAEEFRVISRLQFVSDGLFLELSTAAIVT